MGQSSAAIPGKHALRMLFFILPYLLTANLCLGQISDSLVAFRQNLLKDLPIFSQMVTQLHPLFSKPGIREQISRKIDSLYHMGQPLTISQVASVFRLVNTGGLCSDTHSYFDWRQPGLKVWPYAVRIIGNGLYINQDSVSIPFGAEVTFINGRPAKQFLNLFHSATDKGDDSTMDLSGIEAGFPALWSEEYGPQESFDVEYRWQGKIGHAMLAAIPVETYITTNYAKRADLSPFWIDKSRTFVDAMTDKANRRAFLYLNTFYLSRDSLKAYLDRFFDKLREDSVRSLVIDLTRNGGGLMENVPLLFSYLVDRPFNFSLTLSAYNIGMPFRKYLTGINGTPLGNKTRHEVDLVEKMLWSGFRKTEEGGYEEKIFQTPFEPVVAERRFTGKVYILISGQTFSAACAFASLAKVNKRALLLGMQAAGKAHFMDAAIMLQYRLPYSGMIYSVPTCYVNLNYADGLPDDRCAMLEPDQRVSTAEALREFLSHDGNPPTINKLFEYLGENGK